MKSQIENQTLPKIRSAKYDNLKTLLIFLVIFGHFLRPLIISNVGAKIVYVFIFMFHMPTFIFLMGKFSKPSKNRLLHFIAIYIVSQIIYTPFLHYFYIETIEMTLITPHWMLWYLFSLIIYSALCFVLPQTLSLKKSKIILYSSIAIALLAGYSTLIDDAFALSRTICFLPFFIAGKYQLIEEISKKKWFYGFTATLLTFIYLYGSRGNYEALWFKDGYMLSDSTWYWRLFIIATAFCWIKFLISIIPDTKIPLISKTGKHTLFIYLAHGFIVRLLIYYFESYFTVLNCFIASIIVLLILCGVVTVGKSSRRSS